MLKSIHKPTHLRHFAGQTLGVDAYGWLHRGTVSCAIELAQQKPTRKHIEFALNRVRMLIHFGVKPYLVFDGDYLPSKANTERERAERRKESKKLGLQLLSMGRVSQAYLELQKAVDVTPMMARELIDELKRLDVPYVVAPYEADSQLAYLEKQGTISGVLSEDSDLLVFGVKSLLTKLDQYGECIMVHRDDFTACREISLVGWSDSEFRMMAMLSGCDYLPRVEGMGLKTAYRHVRKHKNVERIVRTLQFDGKMKVQPEYLKDYDKAEKTFLYQWVFCPEARSLVNLNKLPADLSIADMPFLGPQVDAEVAVGVAAGDLDPNTKKRIILHVQTNALNYANRTRQVETPDEKQGKTITEFFRAKRTPLAELDPNSFTPSPSQQRLLQNQQSASWSASQVPNASVPVHTRLSGAHGPSSAPQPARRTASSPWPDTRRVSPKRQRLCSDNGLATHMSGLDGWKSARSHYFSKAGDKDSPSLGRKAESRKGKEEFELWSDDSVAEAVAASLATCESSVVAATPSPKKRKKMQVFADEPTVEQILEAGIPTIAATPSGNRRNVTPADLPANPTDDENLALPGHPGVATSKRSVFDQGINSQFATIASRFTLDSSKIRQTLERTDSIPLALHNPLHQPEPNGLHGRLAKSPAASKLTNDLPTLRPSQPKTHPPALNRSDGLDNEDTISDAEWLEVESLPANPEGNLAANGSEDLLVPNSPDSREEEDDDGRRRPRMRSRPGLDLRSFAFAG